MAMYQKKKAYLSVFGSLIVLISTNGLYVYCASYKQADQDVSAVLLKSKYLKNSSRNSNNDINHDNKSREIFKRYIPSRLKAHANNMFIFELTLLNTSTINNKRSSLNTNKTNSSFIVGLNMLTVYDSDHCSGAIQPSVVIGAFIIMAVVCFVAYVSDKRRRNESSTGIVKYGI